MRKKLLLPVLIFSVGLLSGWFSSSSRQIVSLTELRGQSDLQFTNPLLECDIAEANFRELKPFKQKVFDSIKARLDSGEASHISVYFRDLNNGPWFGINEKEVFSPGSLLKVPFMMAAFKQVESDPDFLNQSVVYSGGNENDKMSIKPRIVMEVGKSYALNDVIRRMIIYSDNDAKDLLLSKINGRTLTRTYEDLGIQGPTMDKTDDFINIKNYASFFRILFNASYLTKEFSEKALAILSEVDFRDGLVAGVPKNMPVAHKFGEREYLGKKQLHDCGIIYYPDHPYLLCVMNRGDDLQKNDKDDRRHFQSCLSGSRQAVQIIKNSLRLLSPLPVLEALNYETTKKLFPELVEG